MLFSNQFTNCILIIYSLDGVTLMSTNTSTTWSILAGFWRYFCTLAF